MPQYPVFPNAKVLNKFYVRNFYIKTIALPALTLNEFVSRLFQSHRFPPSLKLVSVSAETRAHRSWQ